MVTDKPKFWLGCSIFLVLVAVFLFWPNDERAIQKQLEAMAEAASKPVAEKTMAGLVQEKKLANYFYDPCSLALGEQASWEQLTPSDVRTRIHIFRAAFQRVEVSLHDIQIQFPADDTASIHCTLRMRGEQQGQEVADVREVVAAFVKTPDGWLCREIRLVEVLDR